ncbi:unnamed protein product [Didymodactylos carnosus]|uniref:Uncharacterized protein n=1 Tax=Didymodactylos carnosus TaxID=1234261 RepID=A0A8S2VTG5_9BILA|nr:unnamed protein product [Didymodactylos carnosus]
MVSLLEHMAEIMSPLENGIKLMNPYNEEVEARAYIFISPVDKPVRCKVQNHKQFNGEYGCGICEQSGQMLKEIDPEKYSASRALVYPYNNDEPDGPLRTRESIDDCADKAGDTKKCVRGVSDLRPFSTLKHFDIVHGYVIETMHGIHLGALKRLYSLWFNSNLTAPWCLRSYIDEINNNIKENVYVPSGVSRTVRKIKYVHKWKANEIRIFFFCYFPILVKHLPNEYSENYLSFIHAIFLLCTTKKTGDEVQKATILLNSFVENFEKLYWFEEMVSVIHDMLH